MRGTEWAGWWGMRNMNYLGPWCGNLWHEAQKAAVRRRFCSFLSHKRGCPAGILAFSCIQQLILASSSGQLYWPWKCRSFWGSDLICASQVAALLVAGSLGWSLQCDGSYCSCQLSQTFAVTSPESWIKDVNHKLQSDPFVFPSHIQVLQTDRARLWAEGWLHSFWYLLKLLKSEKFRCGVFVWLVFFLLNILRNFFYYALILKELTF